jgi:carbon-monoxide dehydrogenase small subunit
VRTIEGLAEDPVMAVIRECFSEAHGLQCGYCTPGMVITVRDLLKRGKCANAAQIRTELAGNLCRCTGYAGIVKAVELARERLDA